MAQVVVLELINGATLIGRMDPSVNSVLKHTTLTHVRRMIPQQVSRDQVGLAFLKIGEPFIQNAARGFDTVSILDAHIITATAVEQTIANKRLLDEYTKAVSSLVMPNLMEGGNYV